MDETLKNILCDYLNIGYHTKTDRIIELVIDKLDKDFFLKRDDKALLYFYKYNKCMEVIKRFDAGIIGLYDL